MNSTSDNNTKETLLGSSYGSTFKNSLGEEMEILVGSTSEHPPERNETTVFPEKCLNDRWRDCLRDDLNCIPLAIENDWTLKFSYIDKMYGRTTPSDVPHDTLSFIKGDKVCWKVYSVIKENNGIFHPLYEAWRIADYVDGIYCNHRIYEFLRDVLIKE